MTTSIPPTADTTYSQTPQPRLHHPLWIHLPAAGAIAALAGVLIACRPWPARLPLHFGFSGQPDRFGSPWQIVAIDAVFLPLLLAGQVMLAEGWARWEQARRFNWITPLLTALIAGMAGLSAEILWRAGHGPAVFSMPWQLALAMAAGGAALAAALETRRRSSPSPVPPGVLPADVPALVARIAARRPGDRWAYWDGQHPWWLDVLCAGAGGWLLVSSVLVPLWPVRLALMVAAVLLLALLGGYRVRVTPAGVVVRLGLLGVPLIRIPLGQLAAADACAFSPLADFGGWGIRWKPGVLAVYYRGRRGVRVRTTTGKTYLIGSDAPERLEAVLHAARAAST